MLGIISVWYVPMFFIHGPQFLLDFLGVHNFLRATVSEHPENDVWFYYTVVLAAGFLPWVIGLIISARKIELPQLEARTHFLLIWAAAVFVVFQSFATKYPTYTFPYMMPVSILIALVLFERRKLFTRVAAVSAVFLVISTFAGIVICERNSGKAAAEIIAPLADAETVVVSYSRSYPGSITFYSGLKVYRLEDSERLAKLRPAGMSWSAVNVMPFMDFREMPVDKKIIAVVRNNVEGKFLERVSGEWEVVAELAGSKIYRRR